MADADRPRLADLVQRPLGMPSGCLEPPAPGPDFGRRPMIVHQHRIPRDQTIIADLDPCVADDSRPVHQSESADGHPGFPPQVEHDSQVNRRPAPDLNRILHLAATTSEAEVETALQIVLEENKLPSFLTVRDLVQVPTMRILPALSTPELNLTSYDQLIPSSRRACV